MIKTWQQRCEEHPDHEGIVTEQMIRDRMQEEIDELRQALAEPEKTNQCGESCERAKLCATCARELAQPEQEPFEYWNAVEGWVKIDEVRQHFDSVGCGTIYKTPGENRVPLYTAPPSVEAAVLAEPEKTNQCGESCERAKLCATCARELAQPEQEWDSRHPKAQALIGERARLRIELGLVERLVDDPHFETTPSDMEYWGPLHDKLEQALTQPEQEPVAWIGKGRCQQLQEGESVTTTLTSHKAFLDDVALYTAPPKKEWFGLTDEDKDSFWRADQMTSEEWDELFAAVEAKLKEKNGG